MILYCRTRRAPAADITITMARERAVFPIYYYIEIARANIIPYKYYVIGRATRVPFPPPRITITAVADVRPLAAVRNDTDAVASPARKISRGSRPIVGWWGKGRTVNNTISDLIILKSPDSGTGREY